MRKPDWFGHYIKRNESCQRPTRYVFVDVETSQEVVQSTPVYIKHTLKMGVACAVLWRKDREPIEQWFNFETASEFWEWLKRWQKRKSVLWVVAHNAQFDFTILGLWERISGNEYATKRAGREYTDSRTGRTRVSEDWHGMLAIEGSPFHCETESANGRVNFTDLQNYYQCSLAEVAKSVGLVKGVYDDVKDDDRQLRAYCHSDVEILKRGYLGLVDKWQRENNGNWQFSAAGLAYSHYRHRYLDDKIAVHSHPIALQLEWDSLYGGEVRCFYRGRTPGPVHHFDINSLYPSVMQSNAYPTALVDYIFEPNKRQFNRYIEQFAAIATVKLKTGSGNYPVRYKGKICYPIGHFTTTLAGPELLAALKAGHIVGCTAMALYTSAPIFKRYVLDWWERKSCCRQAGDTAGEKFAKLMLNSLPAKFAQRTPSWENEPLIDVVRPWKVFPWKCPKTGTMYTARSVGWVGQVARHRVATEHSFPAVYAFVTAYARVKMRALRKDVAPSHMYYQDTDSLMISSEVFNSGELDHWPIGDGLGELRLIKQYQEATFRGPKNYTVDGRHVIAGIRTRDKELAPMKWSCERFERTNSLFMREPDQTIRTHILDIDTPGSDSEGGITADGYTRPLILPPELHPLMLVELTKTSEIPDFSS